MMTEEFMADSFQPSDASHQNFLSFGEERFRHIFEDAAIPIGICDWDGNFIVFNSAYMRLVGYSLDELFATNYATIVHPDDLPQNKQLIEELRQGQRPSLDLVNRYIHKDGHEVWVRKYISILRDDSGQGTHLIGLITDISEQKQAELSLRVNQERLRAILNSATAAIISINMEGLIESANPATSLLFGYQQDELIGQKINLLMPAPYAQEHDDYIARYLETGEKRIIGIGRELTAVRKDGSVFPVELTVTEVDNFHVFTGFIRDITQRKQEQERLLETERLAGLGEAMASLVHESRNALARIQANLRMLARRVERDDELHKLIDGALSATDDVGRQYEEVREYASPILLKITQENLKQLIDVAWQHLETEQSGRKITLRMTITSAAMNCAVDRQLIVSVFRNILDNALAASPDDAVLVDVTLSETTFEDSPAVEVAIRDYGPGLAAEAAEMALRAFYTTKNRGTGLGLAIARRVVEAHRGRIVIENVDPGQGTGAIVTVTIPRKQPEHSHS